MHVIVWQFQVRAGREQDFEAANGPAGVWARLFQQGAGYRGSQLLRDLEVAGRYLTIDRWTTRAAFESFRRQHAEQYEAIDRECEGLTAQEVALGSFAVLAEPPSDSSRADPL
jgi:heme-degrading monooxygenase HmoA